MEGEIEKVDIEKHRKRTKDEIADIEHEKKVNKHNQSGENPWPVLLLTIISAFNKFY